MSLCLHWCAQAFAKHGARFFYVQLAVELHPSASRHDECGWENLLLSYSKSAP